MMTTSPSSVVQKRDLHIGGIGASGSGALAAVSDGVTHSVVDTAHSWRVRARDAARNTDDFVHGSPWAALAVAAAVGIAAGYIFGRRSS